MGYCMILAFEDDIERLEKSSQEFMRGKSRVRHFQFRIERQLGGDGWGRSGQRDVLARRNIHFSRDKIPRRTFRSLAILNPGSSLLSARK
jgi:hypothetical protein